MSRDASIHVRESDLVKVLKGIFKRETIGELNNEELAKQIVEHSRPFSVYRSITISNDRVQKHANKVMKASRDDTYKVAQLIFFTRQQLKHRGIQVIKPGSKDWEMVKEITDNAINFCNEFSFNKDVGFKKFILIALKKMNKVALNRIPSMYSAICETHMAMDIIENDGNSLGTETLYKVYQSKVIMEAGLMNDYRKLPDKYQYFVKAREVADKYNVNYEDYVIAQFEGLEFTGNYPDPVQLTGEKALERLTKYLHKNNIRVIKQENKPTEMDWTKILD